MNGNILLELEKNINVFIICNDNKLRLIDNNIIHINETLKIFESKILFLTIINFLIIIYILLFI